MQIIATVMSIDGSVDPDVVALLGTSAALSISGLPFKGPIGVARIGYKDGDFLLNPTSPELKNSQLDLVIAGTKTAVLMVESEAKELSEAVLCDAVQYGHEALKTVVQGIEEFVHAVNPSSSFRLQPSRDLTLVTGMLKPLVEASLKEAYQISEKTKRQERVEEIRHQVIQTLLPEVTKTGGGEADILQVFAKLEKEVVRTHLLVHKKRIDGRSSTDIRPISICVGILPRTHGSALFTRGETQALVTTTLGTEKDSQVIDALEGERKEAFLLHYNFPPYCVGEIAQVGSPKRREIGHGRLARRAIIGVMPPMDDFPYAVRIVSEVTESNGSSSMATVCGSSLSLMDAGVPIKEAVAGIAMGLMKEGDEFIILSDILGDEDHFGDMDFKVAGTRHGITALQMDIKIDGVTRPILQVALEQARKGRMHVLGEMEQVIKAPRQEVSKHAPRIISFNINPEKIRAVIGKGGTMIRSIIEETGVTIDISDDGLVKIGAVDVAAGEEARRKIEDLTTEPEIGRVYEGKVIKLLDFGAIVSISGNKEGLVHISEISPERIDKVEDKLADGQFVNVKLIEIDRMGRLRFSIKRV